MTARAFVDTNVLVYAYDGSEPRKQQRARDVLADEHVRRVISTQVLGEFYVTVTAKLASPLPPRDAAEALDALAATVVTIDRLLVHAAIDTSQRHRLSYWDALIVEAAASSNCQTLLTEDLRHGAEIRGVRIENPFAA